MTAQFCKNDFDLYCNKWFKNYTLSYGNFFMVKLIILSPVPQNKLKSNVIILLQVRKRVYFYKVEFSEFEKFKMLILKEQKIIWIKVDSMIYFKKLTLNKSFSFKWFGKILKS